MKENLTGTQPLASSAGSLSTAASPLLQAVRPLQLSGHVWPEHRGTAACEAWTSPCLFPQTLSYSSTKPHSCIIHSLILCLWLDQIQDIFIYRYQMSTWVNYETHNQGKERTMQLHVAELLQDYLVHPCSVSQSSPERLRSPRWPFCSLHQLKGQLLELFKKVWRITFKTWKTKRKPHIVYSTLSPKNINCQI